MTFNKLDVKPSVRKGISVTLIQINAIHVLKIAINALTPK
jgi:hypothetical protein